MLVSMNCSSYRALVSLSRDVFFFESASNNNKAVSIDTYYVSARAGTRTYTQEDRTCGHAWFYAISLCPQRD